MTSTPHPSSRRRTTPLRRAVQRATRGRLGDRGSVLVEFALVLPLLALLMLGIFEFGLGWRAKINLETAASLAARQSSNIADQRPADYESLQSLKGSISSAGNLRVTKVVVYKATGAAGQPANASCLTLTPNTTTRQGISGSCNVYGATQLQNMSATNFGWNGTTYASSCGSNANQWDSYWCPTSRNGDQGDVGGLDYLAIQVTAELPSFSRLFGTQWTLRDTAVYRLEPDPQ